MTKEALINILWKVLDDYGKSLRGIEYDLIYASYTSTEDIQFRLVYKYVNCTIPYGATIPRFWLEMSESFVAKNFETMIRNVIKSSFSVEIERIFGGKTGFNPL